MTKNFKTAAENTKQVYDQLIGNPVEEVEASMKTQGKKGEKLPRINLALSEDNYDFVVKMARMHGMTITKYVNIVVAEERARNAGYLAEVDRVLSHLPKKEIKD